MVPVQENEVFLVNDNEKGIQEFTVKRKKEMQRMEDEK
jgi:hypothetical protein